MMASSSEDEDNEPQITVHYVLCPGCGRPTFFCPDCGKEVKLRSKFMEGIVLLLCMVYKLREEAALAEAMSSTTLDTTISSEQPQQSPQAQQQSNVLEQPRETLIDTQASYPRGQPQLPLSLEASTLSHPTPVSPQPEETSAIDELAMVPHRYARPDWQSEQVFAGQYGSCSQVGTTAPRNYPNSQTDDEAPSSPHQQADLSPTLSASDDDDDDHRRWSVSSSQFATDGSEPGSRKLRRKDFRAIEQAKVPKHLKSWPVDGFLSL